MFALTLVAVSAPLVMHVSSSSYHILTRCGTVVALSAPLVMLLCDSHIPINVPFAFRDKQPCLIFYRARLRGGSRATASIEPLASLIRLSKASCRVLSRGVAVAVSLCAAWSSQNWMASAGPRRPAQRLVRRVIAGIEEQDSGLQMTPPTSSGELRERL